MFYLYYLLGIFIKYLLMFVFGLLCVVQFCVDVWLLYVAMSAPVGKNGFANYCEGKLKIWQSINQSKSINISHCETTGLKQKK